MGSVFVQVYADPWLEDPPELSDDAEHPFIPLVGNHSRRVSWPPAVAVDDVCYDLLRIDTDPVAEAETVEAQGHDIAEERVAEERVPEERVAEELFAAEPDPITAPADDDWADEGWGDEHGIATRNGDGGGWASVLQIIGTSPEPVAAQQTIIEPAPPPLVLPETVVYRPEPDAGVVAEPPTWSAAESGVVPPAEEGAAAAAEDPTPTTTPARSHRVLALAALAFVIAVGLLGFGLSQRSDAARSRAKVTAAQRRNSALQSAVKIKTEQLAATSARLAQLNARVAALSSGKPTANSPRVQQLVNAIPAATDGARNCASSALAAASKALDFASAFPTSASGVDAAASSVASVCGRATTAANALDNLADAAQR
jgi:hypothetical protein